MIDFTTVTKDVCIFYLGGIAGDEGPILNILKTTDNRYYFNYWVYDAVFYEDDKAINITKETTIGDIKRLFSEENLRNKDLYLYDIFDPKDGQVFYETTDRTYEPTTFETVKERFEDTVNNYEFLGILNWTYDNKDPEEILPFILNELESEN